MSIIKISRNMVKTKNLTRNFSMTKKMINTDVKLSIWLVCLSVDMFVSKKRKNVWTDQAHFFGRELTLPLMSAQSLAKISKKHFFSKFVPNLPRQVEPSKHMKRENDQVVKNLDPCIPIQFIPDHIDPDCYGKICFNF